MNMDMDKNQIKQDIHQLFKRQRDAFYHTPIPDLKQRQDLLQRLHRLLVENKNRLVEAITNDFGHRSRDEILLTILLLIEEINYAKKNLHQWMQPKKRKISALIQFAYAKLIPQPLGVIGIFAGWNEPLLLSIGPLIGALAAGNRVMIKAATLLSATNQLLNDLFSRYFSPTEVCFVLETIPHVKRIFSHLPFDHVLFTGSSRTGRIIMRAASYHLTPVTLELGGKSPAIIATDANLEAATDKIICSKLYNSGQICIASDYVLLPTGEENEFINLAKKVVAKRYPTVFNNPDYTCIINEDHMRRLQQYLEDATAKGATVIPLSQEKDMIHAGKMSPVIILNAKPGMLVMEEEIFGPILPIVTYPNLQAAVEFINQRPKPLALYYFGKDENQINYVIKNTFSGGVTINDALLHFTQPSLPFGGVGASGMGNYHGEYGFNTFSKLKPVVYQRRFNFSSMIFPPYSKLYRLLLQLKIR